MSRTLEEYLIDVHAKQYVGLDDEMPEDFDNWIEQLDPIEWEVYATKWHISQLKDVLERVKSKISEHNKKTWLQNYDYGIEAIDEELARIKVEK